MKEIDRPMRGKNPKERKNLPTDFVIENARNM